MLNQRSKKFLIAALLITLVALLIRLLVAYELYSFNGGYNAVQHPPASTDMATYMKLSRQISAGKYHGEFNYQPFYYAVALPIVNFIFHNNLWGVILFQALLGAATTFLTALSAAKLCGRRGGYIAAGLTAGCGIMIVYTPFHLIATLQAFWLILLFYLTLLTIKHNRIFYWGLLGLVTGYAILTRGNIWLLVPGLSLLAIHRGRQNFAKTKSLIRNSVADDNANIALSSRGLTWLYGLMPLLLLIIMLLLPQLPFAWHNSRIKGCLCGPSTAADQVLALGNTPEAPPGGRNPEQLAGPMEYPPSYQVWMKAHDSIPVAQRILRWFVRQPGAYLELTFRKLLLFWNWREIPNNISYIQARAQSPKLRLFGFIPSGIIMLLTIAALLLHIKQLSRRPSILLLYYFIIAYWLSTALFYILARFRMPLLPLMAVAAALGIEWLFRHRRAPRPIMLSGIAALLAGYFICYQAYDLYRNNLEATIVRWTRPNGTMIQLADDSYMVLDNGPLTFGGWRVIPLTDRAIQKKFIIPSTSRINDLRVKLPLVAQRPGTATITVNHQVRQISFAHAGLSYFTFALPTGSSGNLNLRYLGGTTPVAAVVDYQRNYGRTFVKSKAIAAELVCRILWNSKASGKTE